MACFSTTAFTLKPASRYPRRIHSRTAMRRCSPSTSKNKPSTNCTVSTVVNKYPPVIIDVTNDWTIWWFKPRYCRVTMEATISKITAPSSSSHSTYGGRLPSSSSSSCSFMPRSHPRYSLSLSAVYNKSRNSTHVSGYGKTLSSSVVTCLFASRCSVLSVRRCVCPFACDVCVCVCVEGLTFVY